jgi:hypothetical protein
MSAVDTAHEVLEALDVRSGNRPPASGVADRPTAQPESSTMLRERLKYYTWRHIQWIKPLRIIQEAGDRVAARLMSRSVVKSRRWSDGRSRRVVV